MKKIACYVIILLICVPVIGLSQWEYETFIADTMFPANGWTHGLAVDAENKVWSHSYFTVLSRLVTEAGDTIGVDPLWIMDENGTPVDSIKYFMIDGEQFPLRNGRGLRADHEGNILATYEDRMFRINHKTFELMDHYRHPNNLALVAPGVDAEGNIYVGTVLAEAPVRVYDADFNFIMPAITPTGISRTIDVTPDGLTLFYMAPHENAVLKYTRPDEFDVFPEVPDTILHGMNVTASMVNRVTGHLWVNSGLNPNQYPGVETNWTPATFYAYDPESGEVVDHIQWHNLENSYVKIVDGQVVFADPDEDGVIGPGMRAFAFSGDGNTAYLGQWTIRIVPAIQKFTRGPVSVEKRDNLIAQHYELLQNYPNPFNPSTTIQFALPQQIQVLLEIYNILGQRVKVLVAGEVYQSGIHNVVWNGMNEQNTVVPSGLYIYRITAGDFVASKRMIFLK